MMDTKITKEKNIVKIITTQTEIIDIDQLKKELEMLENEPPPSNEEKIRAAEEFRTLFYYSPERQQRIEYLRGKIKEFESL